MKVPKKDGTTQPNNSGGDNWEDIICDKCGKSCLNSTEMNFEYATITAHWGYGSNKDLEKHEAHVCEKCYDDFHLKSTVTYYM